MAKKEKPRTTPRQREIITEIAKERRVENFVRIICKVTNVILNDLAQVVYLALLEYDGQKIEELHENNSLNFFIVRIIKNQWNSNTSPFYNEMRKFSRRSNSLGEIADKV